VEKVEFQAIEGWSADDHSAALDCYLQSAALNSLPLPAGSAPRGPESARAFFEENFAAFRVLAAPGLLTSYFEPVLRGSLTPSPGFPVPVYRRPDE
jgi:membrane-bound lytic murein transglycosylase A